MEKVKTGDVFIIPNGLMSAANTCGNCRWEKDTEFRARRSRYHEKILALADSQYVEVWCVTPGEDDSNWCCHKEMPNGEGFVSHLPVSLFKGKHEGDTITLPTKWGIVELTLNQLKYRYRSQGKFEDCLQKLINFDLLYKVDHYDNLPYLLK